MADAMASTHLRRLSSTHMTVTCGLRIGNVRSDAAMSVIAADASRISRAAKWAATV